MFIVIRTVGVCCYIDFDIVFDLAIAIAFAVLDAYIILGTSFAKP